MIISQFSVLSDALYTNTCKSGVVVPSVSSAASRKYFILRRFHFIFSRDTKSSSFKTSLTVTAPDPHAPVVVRINCISFASLVLENSNTNLVLKEVTILSHLVKTLGPLAF